MSVTRDSETVTIAQILEDIQELSKRLDAIEETLAQRLVPKTYKWHFIGGTIDSNWQRLSQQDRDEIIREHYPSYNDSMMLTLGGHWYTTDLDTPVPRTIGGRRYV
jgi:hypothetical protein